jgi:glycosyltransferase involved in cell wall biosynthesis
MKIVYDLQAYSFSPHGGIARLFDAMLGDFKNRPGFSALLHTEVELKRTPPRAANVNVRGLPPFPPLLRASRAARFLYSALDRAYWKGHGPELYHPTFYPTHAKFLHLPMVVNVYDLIHEHVEHADDMPDHEEFKQRKKRFIERADRLICISEATRSDLLSYYRVQPDRVRVVHLSAGPGFERWPDETARPAVAGLLGDADRPYLLFVGARQRYKNFHRLVQALQGWRGRADFDLVVVGPPRKMSDLQILDVCGAGLRVTFVEHVDDRALCALYNRARALIYPSEREGFGIPLLEAMASGCPVCASDLPVFREIGGSDALYFDPRSPESIQSALDRVVALKDDPGWLERQQQRARRFSWPAATEKVWAVYQELL